MQINNRRNMTEIIEYMTINETFNCDFELNISLIPFPNREALTEPLMFEEYVKIIFYLIVLIIALVGNISVILTVLLNRTMRTTINLYLVNLAVADLFICVFCMWIPVANSLTKPLYSLGVFICKLNPFAQSKFFFMNINSQGNLQTTATLQNWSLVRGDRFLGVCFYSND